MWNIIRGGPSCLQAVVVTEFFQVTKSQYSGNLFPVPASYNLIWTPVSKNKKTCAMAVVTGEMNYVSHTHEWYVMRKARGKTRKLFWERQCHSLNCNFFLKRIPSSDKFISSLVVSYLPRQIMYNAYVSSRLMEHLSSSVLLIYS